MLEAPGPPPTERWPGSFFFLIFNFFLTASLNRIALAVKIGGREGTEEESLHEFRLKQLARLRLSKKVK